MSLDQVRAFLEIARCGSISGGARRLHISQPPLTRMIRALEDELESRLFERHRGGVRLTEVGRVFQMHAQGIVAAVDAARAAVNVASRVDPGSATWTASRDEPQARSPRVRPHRP